MAPPRPPGGDGGRSRGSGGPPPRGSSTGKRDARPRYGAERTPRYGADRDQSGRPAARGRSGSTRGGGTSGRPDSTRSAPGSGRGARAGGPDRPPRGSSRTGTGSGRTDRPTGASRGGSDGRTTRAGDRPAGPARGRSGSGRAPRTGDRPEGGAGRGARSGGPGGPARGRAGSGGPGGSGRGGTGSGRTGDRATGSGRGGPGSGRSTRAGDRATGGSSRGWSDRPTRATGSESRRRDNDRTPRYGAERYDDREMRGPRSWGGLARRGAGRATRASDAWRAAGSDSAAAGSAEPGWQPEEWIDEGELRDEAAEAIGRSRRAASRPSPERRPAAKAPVDEGGAPGDDVRRAVPANRLARFEARLKDASDAFRRERYEDARRTLRPLAEQASGASSVRELYGLTLYRLGRWTQAARELEAFRTQTGSTEQHPVLADSYRALGRYADVEELWEELRAASPSAELVAEGRIVAAGALADQGRLEDAIELLAAGAKPTKKARLHHLRMAYALADLYERAGDLPRARELFGRVATTDPDFVDVQARLRALR